MLLSDLERYNNPRQTIMAVWCTLKKMELAAKVLERYNSPLQTIMVVCALQIYKKSAPNGQYSLQQAFIPKSTRSN
jgi:hypothetical protein